MNPEKERRLHLARVDSANRQLVDLSPYGQKSAGDLFSSGKKSSGNQSPVHRRNLPAAKQKSDPNIGADLRKSASMPAGKEAFVAQVDRRRQSVASNDPGTSVMKKRLWVMAAASAAQTAGYDRRSAPPAISTILSQDALKALRQKEKDTKCQSFWQITRQNQIEKMQEHAKAEQHKGSKHPTDAKGRWKFAGHMGKEENSSDANRNKLVAIFSAAQMNEVMVARIEQELLRKADAEKHQQYDLFFMSAKSGAVDAVAVLLRNGANPNARDLYGNPVLHQSCYANQPECVDALITFGSDVHEENPYQSTALHWACMSDVVPCAKLLLQHKADPVAKDRSHGTPLHWAARRNAVGCLQLLLERNAEVDCLDKVGQAPLQWACLEDAADCMMVLLEKGAHVDQTDDSGRSPLHCAVIENADKCAALLIKARADVLAVDSDGSTALDLTHTVEAIHPSIQEHLWQAEVKAEMEDTQKRQANLKIGVLNVAVESGRRASLMAQQQLDVTQERRSLSQFI